MDKELSKIYSLFVNSKGVCIDTRKITEDEIFVALKGENFDGNKFVKQALEKGAKLAIVSNSDIKGDNVIYVEDTLKFLQDLASFHIRQLDIPVIAITGTNGKTTTKELIGKVLSSEFNVFYTKGNFNNHIGVPLSILQITTDHEIAVIEMGASKPGDIKELCKIADPKYGLITNIGKAHWEFFGTQENLIATKQELFDYLNSNNGTIFYNCRLSNFIDKEIFNCKNLSYGVDRLDCNYNASGFTHDTMFCGVEVNDTKIYSNLSGIYNAENILAAVVVGLNFGISLLNIKYEIESYYPKNNRSQYIKTNNNKIIIDAYNANPSSMEQSVSFFLQIPSEYHKVLILGDMLELGKESKKEHKRILDIIVRKHSGQTFLVGSNFYKFKNMFTKHNLLFFISTDEVISFLKRNPLHNKFILLKGSRGIKLETLLEYL